MVVKRVLFCLVVLWPGMATLSVVGAEFQVDPTEKLFDPLHLVDVRIEMAPDDWEEIRLQTRQLMTTLREGQQGTPFTYVKGNVWIDGVLIENVGIRKKGFLGSLDTIRPSLKIRFDEYVEQAPFGKLDRLTLNNNKQDPSRLSQYLSYKTFRASGAVASRCNFAKVTVNGQNLGIYSNVESVKTQMLERGFGNGTGPLFEGTATDISSDLVHLIEQKTDNADPKDLKALAHVVEEPTLDVDKLEAVLDVNAFVRFWATESLIGFWDGYSNNQNNYFIYQDPANQKYYFLPWGTDSAFTSSVPLKQFRITHRSVHSKSLLANRLYRNPQIRALYRKSLVELLSKHWDEDELLADVDRVAALIKNDLHQSDKDFSRAVGKVRAFIRGRRRVMERELEKWPRKLTRGPKRSGRSMVKEIGHGKATFSTKWYADSPAKPETLGQVKIELDVNGDLIVFRKIGAHAAPSKEMSWNSSSRQKPPTVVLTGIRASDGKRVTLLLNFDKGSLRPAKKPVPFSFGLFIEGNMLSFIARAVFNPSSLRFLEGEITFDEASMEPDAPVRGTMEFHIFMFQGDEAGEEVPWEEN